jgi:putative SOS response-associated peptidase YedK
MAKIHNRMPVILPPNAWEEWLDPDEAELGSLDHLLTAYPADQMEAYEVSTLVNSPANDTPECIAAAA